MKHHYNDPTANTAVANADRDLRKRERRKPAAKPKRPVIQDGWRYVRFDENGFIIFDSCPPPAPDNSSGLFLCPLLTNLPPS